MRLNGRTVTSAVLVAAALLLAALVGAIIPLASGDVQRQEPEPWTMPTPTGLPSATSTPTSYAPTPQPNTPTPTAALDPPSARETPTAAPTTPTSAPTAASEPGAVAPKPSGTSAPRLRFDQTQVPADTAIATVRYDPLSLRRGPNTDAALIGTAKLGDIFAALGRSADDAWLKVCCVNDGPAWLAARFVEVSVPLTSLPVAEP